MNFVKVASKINKHNLEESYEDFPSEKIHTNFCKFLIGANKSWGRRNTVVTMFFKIFQ